MRCVSSAPEPRFHRNGCRLPSSRIAAATGLFSIVNAALLNPFPFADINRIVRLDMIDKGKPRGLGVTARQLVALQHSDVLDGAFRLEHLGDDADRPGPPRSGAHPVFFSKRFERPRVPPLLGRVFTRRMGRRASSPSGSSCSPIGSGSDTSAGGLRQWGRRFYLNREPYTVIGVLSRQYFYTGPEILVPIHLTFDPNFAWNVQARLKRGVNPRMAEQRLQPLFDQFAKEAPQRFPKGVRPLVRSLVETQRAAALCRPSC